MNAKQFGMSLSIILLIFASMNASLMAQGRGNGNGGGGGGGGGNDATHDLVDLLGIPGDNLQSAGQYLTNRDTGGSILIAGNSHWYSGEPDTPPRLAVTWDIDSEGNLAEGDPVHLGLPSLARGLEVRGLNRHGVVIATTDWAAQKDEDGNWIFPAFVAIPGHPWQEIPIPAGASRNTWLAAVNNAGQIIGSYKIPDPNNPPHSAVTYTAVWQVETDGTISGPVIIDDSTAGPRFQVSDLNNFGVMAGNLDGWPTIGWLENGALQTVSLGTSLRFFGADVEALNDFPILDSRLTVVGSARADENGDFAAPDRGYAWRPFDFANPTTLIGPFSGQDSDSWAFDVNNSGQIVGMAEQKRGARKPFLFADGEMKDLNSLVETGRKSLGGVNAINNQGDITGWMRIPRPVSEIHGYLLRAKDQ